MIYKDQTKEENNREFAISLPEEFSLSPDVSYESKMNSSTGKEAKKGFSCVSIIKFLGLVYGIYFVAFLICYLKISQSSISQPQMNLELENIFDGLAHLKTADLKLRNQLLTLDIMSNEPTNTTTLMDFYQRYSIEFNRELEKKLNQQRQLRPNVDKWLCHRHVSQYLPTYFLCLPNMTLAGLLAGHLWAVYRPSPTIHTVSHRKQRSIHNRMTHGQHFVLVFLLITDIVSSCRIETALHGVYKKQSYAVHNIVFDSTASDPVIYDDLTISATAISEYGECYEKAGDSYVFGMKRMGRTICFRCITPIIRSSNVIQLAHQQEDVCYESVKEARSTCFDAALVSLADGSLIFKSENIEHTSCGVDGRLAVGYQLNGAELRCAIEAGSTADNCDGASLMRIKFHNCSSFPDFDMALRCIGSWQDNSGLRYVIMLNEEKEEYRCGILTTGGADSVVHFANDSSCAQLTERNAFEKFTFRANASERPFSPCQFPQWLRGDFDSLSVSPSSLTYFQGGARAVPITSHCVRTESDRILVYSETKCGDSLGYHCLWFNPRSENLIEFKTTTPTESPETAVCSDDTEFAALPWTSALVRNPGHAPCGILGKYRTPSDLRIEDCYNVSVDCTRTHSLKITAFDCKSGVVFDSRSYTCVASWKDDNFLYMYTTRTRESHSCFVTQYSGGRLFLSSTGSHCERGFNYTANTAKTIVLEEDAPCGSGKIGKPGKSKASRRPSHSSRIAQGAANLVPPTTSTSPTMETPPTERRPVDNQNTPRDVVTDETTPAVPRPMIDNSGPHWLWEGNASRDSYQIVALLVLVVSFHW